MFAEAEESLRSSTSRRPLQFFKSELALPPLDGPAWREYALLALTLVTVFLACYQPLWDPDSYWHLAVGREIWTTGRLVHTETFSFTAHGVPWEDTEWLFHLLGYLLWLAGEERGIAFFTGLAGVAVLGLMYRNVRLAGGNAMTLALYTALMLGVLQTRIRFRPDLASLALMAVLIEILLRQRDVPEKAGRLAAGLSALFWLWAQLHGGWSFGLALLGAFLAGSALDALRERRFSWGFLGRLAVLGVGPAAALFVNPYTWRVPWFPVKSLLGFWDPTLVQIVEWNRTPFEGGMALYLVASFLVGLLLLIRWRELSWRLALPVWLQVFLGWYWARYAAVTAAALAPAAAAEMGVLTQSPKLKKFAWGAALSAMLALGLYEFSRWPKVFDLSEKYPVKEVQFLNANHIGGNLFNEYIVGGYLDWTATPSCRVFMDGRYYPFVTPLQEYWLAHRTFQDYKEFLAKYPFDILLYPYPWFRLKEKAEGSGNALRGPTVLLFPPDRWALVYFGNYGMVFVKREPKYEEVIRRFEYRLLRPDDLAYLVKQAREGTIDGAELAGEIRRKLQEDPWLRTRAALGDALRALEKPHERPN
jgi:hypothetical protein